MIRPFTCLCLAAAAGSGLYLYTAKHDAQMLERDIGRISHQAQESRARAAMLRAEYDRLGDPDRLRELASQVLTLQPTDPRQFSSMAELEQRLPAVGRRAEEPSPVVVVPIAAPAAGPATGQTPISRPAPPAPVVRPATPIVTASLAPVPVPPPASLPPPVPVVVRAAPPVPQPRPVPAAVVTPASQPTPAPPLLATIRRAEPAAPSLTTDVVARVARAAVNVPAAPPQPQGLAARPAISPNLTSPMLSSPVLASPMVASALGMARSAISAANPISQGNAASFAPGATALPAGVPRR